VFVNGKRVGETRVERTVPARFSADETFDVGKDTGTAASAEYTSPFVFRARCKGWKST